MKKFVFFVLLIALSACGNPLVQSEEAATCDASYARETCAPRPVDMFDPTTCKVECARWEPTAAPAPAVEAVEEPVLKSRELVTSTVVVTETLQMTLDEFGIATRYDDRFTLGGLLWDQSYLEGEVFVANMFATHDHDFKSQDGCVVTYYEAPPKGGRIRFTGWNGMGFELDANSGVSLNQAIAAMRETLVRAHGCEQIEYHQLFRHGDPVK